MFCKSYYIINNSYPTIFFIFTYLFIGFFSYQGYWLTAGLYALFTGLAIMGLREWRTARVATR